MTVAAHHALVEEDAPLTTRLARVIASYDEELPSAVLAKLRLCVLDFFSCALESRALPWARQAASLVEGEGSCTVIGSPHRAFAGDAAFANAVAGHGLVREDMHAGAVSHLGVVVLPTLLAVAEQRGLSGAAFARAAVVGYEVGARIGRAIVTPAFGKMFRPTGFTGPLAGAAALGNLLRLSEEEIASALAFASNMTGGLNQWPYTGSDEMFFHPGHASASALRAVRLAMAGARGAPLALDGEAGLIRAYRPDRTVPPVRLFDGSEPEIMSVYFKAAPVCNFAQTPCQAAMELVRAEKIDPNGIKSVKVRVTDAARLYPGCDHPGPFERVLQAKMSIHYAVASALLRGEVDEASYRDLDDPALTRLARVTIVESDPAFTAAFPARQGAAIEVTMTDGRVVSRSLANVMAADADLIHGRFDAAATEFAGASAARSIADAVAALDAVADMGGVMRLLSR